MILTKYYFLLSPRFFRKAKGILLSPPSVRLSVMLSPPKPLAKFNQIWCVGYSHEWGVQRQFIFAPPPGEGSKCQISLNFNYKVNLKYFIPNLVYVLTNERYKTYQTRFSFCRLGHALGLGLGYLVVQN